jgi:iron complex outermembrane recepter protein
VKKFVLFCTTAIVSSAAIAQSTGTIEAEKQIVVTGTRTRSVGGVQTPDTPKAKVVLDQAIISRSNPGQSILDTINLVPGVSFQNNDAYGSAGGTLVIRGFDSTRISLTFDGVPLNDSGNYAIFSNQQLDPELIDQVNVNLGTTDVDSPTASAVGGTVNYLTIVPSVNPGVRVVGSVGDWSMWRLFGLVNTGEIGPWGTRIFLSTSREKYDVPFNGYGKISKRQFNGRVYQTIGSSGDFMSLAFNYNENRNNFFGSLPLRTDTTQSAVNPAPRIVGPNSQNRFPTNADERFYKINFPCTIPAGRPGVADAPPAAPNADEVSCGTEFDRRYNPSNTGNIRGSSRFALADNLILTVDPSWQYVKANGGGTVTAQEGALRDINPAGGTATPAQCRTTPNSATNTCIAGFLGGTPFVGHDLNGDGDTLDTVTVLAPSQTHTSRYGVIAGLRWDFAKGQYIRGGYTLDDARHRQTGEVGLLQPNGEPVDVFPRNDPIKDAFGVTLQKRNRLSFAVLHKLWSEYHGNFGNLSVNVGLAYSHFIRNLNNFCFTSSASGFVECTGDPARDALIASLNPFSFNPVTGKVTGFAPPQHRRLTYNKLLPNVGFVYYIVPKVSAFANYSKGLSVPSTDNLYNSFFFPQDTTAGNPKPELTDNFDGGFRYTTGKIQAQLAGWYTHFTNRQASAFDPELNATVFRNLGTVDKWGIDGSVSYQPVRDLTLYVFGSWNRSKIQDNIQTGLLGAGVTCDTVDPLSTAGIQNCAFTKGNRESGAPEYTYGGSATGDIGPVKLGVEAKRTGPRFVFDNNMPVFRGDIGITTPTAGRIVQEQIFSAKAPAYWLVNLDARLKLDWVSPAAVFKNSYFQFNLYNAFDKFFVGGFGGGLAQSTSTRTCNATSTPRCPGGVGQPAPATVATFGGPPFVQIGAPRTAMASLNIQF